MINIEKDYINRINANLIRVGALIYHEKKCFKITESNHIKPGKGGAFMQVKGKDIHSNSKLDHRFRAEETVEKIHVESRSYLYSYSTKDTIIAMDNETFEEKELEKELFDGKHFLLEEGMSISIHSAGDNAILSVNLPDTIIVKIEKCDPSGKGQMVSSSFKPARIAGDIQVMVPQFVDVGEEIVIRTEDMTYISRKKKN